MRTTALACPYCRNLLPTDTANCQGCYVFEATRASTVVLPPHLFVPVQCIEVRITMLKALRMEVRALEKRFRTTITASFALHKYWEQRLYDLQGQLHKHDDLAMLLDPLHGTDVYLQKSTDTFREYLPPFPPSVPGYEAAHVPGSSEPWLSTVLNRITVAWDTEIGQANPTYDHGNPNLHPEM